MTRSPEAAQASYAQVFSDDPRYLSDQAEAWRLSLQEEGS